MGRYQIVEEPPKAGRFQIVEGPTEELQPISGEPVSRITAPTVLQAPASVPQPPERLLDLLRLNIPSGVYPGPPRPGLLGETELRAPGPPAPTGTIEEAPGQLTEFYRRLKERTGLGQPGLLAKALSLPLAPFSAAGELVDIPYRAIHGYGPGEGGVSPGQLIEKGLPVAMVAGMGGTPGILGQASRVKSRLALLSPQARGIVRDMAEAAARGETGQVMLQAAKQLRQLGVREVDIGRKLLPILERDALMLGSIPSGKATPVFKPEIEAAIARVAGKISVGEKPARRIPSPSDLYRDYVDSLNPVKKLLDKTVPAEAMTNQLNPYEAFRLLPGSWGKVDSFLSYKRFNIKTLKWGGESLQDVLYPLRAEKDKLRTYWTARRALELEQDGFKTGFDVKDLKLVVQELKKRYEPAAKRLTAYDNAALKTLYDAGIVNKDEFKRMLIMNKNYAPLNRIAPDREVIFSSTAEKAMRTRAKSLEPTKPLYRLHGSQRDIMDPLESSIRNTYVYIRAADKNLAMQKLIEWSEKYPEFGKFFKPVKSIAEAEVEVPDELLAQQIKKFGVSQNTLRALTPDGFVPKANTIAVWRDGKRVLYEVHPDIVRAVKSMDATEIGMWTKLFYWPTRVLRAGATLAPEFIPRNISRDQLSAFIWSKYGYIPGVDFARGIAHVINQDKFYWQWKIAGGEHSMLVSLDRVTLQKDLTRVLSKMGGLETGRFRWLTYANPVEALRMWSMFGEKGTRVGEFAKAVKKLGTSKEALQKGAFGSREVSLDFARMGAKGRTLNMLIAFWNANIQGIDKTIRAFKDEAAGGVNYRTVVKIGAGITLPSLLLVASNMQDGRWEEIPSWQKDLFWIIPTGFVSKQEWAGMSPELKAQFAREHPIIRIPKPYEIGLVFGSAPERIFEYMMREGEKKDKDILNNWLAHTADYIWPGAIPTAALPIWELARNRSSFTGSRILPRGQEDVLPAYQARTDTPEMIKGLSTALASLVGEERTFSPIHATHLIRGWTGGLGWYALFLSDQALGAAGVAPQKALTEREWYEMTPFVRGFVAKYPTGGMQPIVDFFDKYQRVNRQAATTRVEAERLKLGYVNLPAMALSAESRKAYTAIVNALSTASDIDANPMLDIKQKRQMIDTILFSASVMSQAGNTMLDKLGEATRHPVKRPMRWKIVDLKGE